METNHKLAVSILLQILLFNHNTSRVFRRRRQLCMIVACVLQCNTHVGAMLCLFLILTFFPYKSLSMRRMHDDVDELDIDQSKFLTTFACYILLDMISGNVINNVFTASCKIILKCDILTVHLYVLSTFFSKILVLLVVLFYSKKNGIFSKRPGQKRSLFAFIKSTFSNFIMTISLAYLLYFIWSVGLDYLKKNLELICT